MLLRNTPNHLVGQLFQSKSNLSLARRLAFYFITFLAITHVSCVHRAFRTALFTYIGVEEINAVQALAPVNAALDAAE